MTLQNHLFQMIDKDSSAVTLNDTHQPTLTFMALNQLRRQNQFCDIQIHIRDAIFTAHRVILAASSPYLCKLLSTKPTSLSHITLSELDIEIYAIDMLIEFLYTSILRITPSTVRALCYAAKILKLTRVEKACCKFMSNTLDELTNVIAYLVFANDNGYYKLEQKCIDVLNQSVTRLSSNDSFLSFSLTKLFNFLDLFHPSDNQLSIDLLLSWISHNPLMRQKELPHLLTQLQIPLPNDIDQYFTADLSQEDRTESTSLTTLQRQHDSNQYLSSILKTIFIVGGNTNKYITSSCERYSSRHRAWQSIASLPHKKSHMSMVVHGNTIFSIGGCDGNKRLSTMDIYNPVLDRWSEGPSLIHSRSASAAVVFRGEIFVIGGYDGSQHLNHVEIFNPKRGDWRDGPPLQQARSYVQATVIEGELYVIGGANNHGRLDSVEKLIDCKKWENVAALTTPRSRPGVVSAGGHIYAIGGYDGKTHLSSVERYDPHTDVWNIITNMSTPRNSPGVGAMGKELYVFGGYDGRSILQSMEIYNIESETWSPAVPMTTPRCDFGFVTTLFLESTDV